MALRNAGGYLLLHRLIVITEVKDKLKAVSYIKVCIGLALKIRGLQSEVKPSQIKPVSKIYELIFKQKQKQYNGQKSDWKSK